MPIGTLGWAVTDDTVLRRVLDRHGLLWLALGDQHQRLRAKTCPAADRIGLFGVVHLDLIG
jgi:hypothetical protein